MCHPDMHVNRVLCSHARCRMLCSHTTVHGAVQSHDVGCCAILCAHTFANARVYTFVRGMSQAWQIGRHGRWGVMAGGAAAQRCAVAAQNLARRVASRPTWSLPQTASPRTCVRACACACACGHIGAMHCLRRGVAFARDKSPPQWKSACMRVCTRTCAHMYASVCGVGVRSERVTWPSRSSALAHPHPPRHARAMHRHACGAQHAMCCTTRNKPACTDHAALIMTSQAAS